jgi:septal ring factor EnvC (AmiA/AmiB activator)
MIRKIILIALILCGVCSAYSQDLVKEFKKLTLENDNLQKALKAETDRSQQILDNFQQTSQDLRDTIKTLKADLSKLEKFKADKKAIDAQLQQKSDLIASLESIISEKDRQIANVRQEGDKKARIEFDKGKDTALAEVIRAYNKPFDP